MAEKIRQRRSRRVAHAEDIIEEAAQEEVITEIENADDDFVEVTKPVNRSTSRRIERRVARELQATIEEPEEDDVDDEEDYEPVKAQPAEPTGLTLRSRKHIDEIKPVVEQIDTHTLFGDNPLTSVISSMPEDQVILIQRLTNDMWVMRIGDKELAVKPKLEGVEYWNEVINPAYKKWQSEWAGMPYDEKVQYCKNRKIEWEDCGHIQINSMKISEAVRKHLKLEKYKPEYMSRKARAEIRG